MEDTTDQPFRTICKELGADIVYTEFVNAEGLVREDEDGPSRTRRKLLFGNEERPLGIQLYGASRSSMQRATTMATALAPDLIDVNCGCWVRKVAGAGAGAGLLRDLPRMREIVSTVVRSTHLPVTVKTRLGWDAGSIRILEVARMMEDCGVQALTVHCRTRAQGHKGRADHSWIPRIKDAVDIPIVLNGDVTTPAQVRAAFETTGCDGVMIGRGALRNPWIFREAKQYLREGELLPAPSWQDRARLCLRHLELAIQHHGERRAQVGLHRYYAGYFNRLPGSSKARAELAQCTSASQLRDRLGSISSRPDCRAEPGSLPAGGG